MPAFGPSASIPEGDSSPAVVSLESQPPLSGAENSALIPPGAAADSTLSQTSPQELDPSIEATIPLEPQMPELGSGLRSRLASLRLQLPKLHAPTSSDSARPVSAPAETSNEEERLASVRDFNPMPDAPPPPDKTSDEIFAEIGQQLRERREMLSLTYEEIERHTHVRTAFLSALERGALDELPSPVQMRGILVNYATFLDLDVDTLLLRFADSVQARYRESGPKKPVRARSHMTINTSLPPLRTFIASDLVFGGGLAIMLLLFAIWGISRVMTVRSETAPRVTPPSISDVLAGTALPTLVQQVTVIPAQDTPVPLVVDTGPTLEPATQDPAVKIKVDVTASERTYMRVTVDGKLKFEGRTDPGSQYSYEAAEQVEIVVGNAAALRINYNSRDLGLMGNFGEVVDRLYTVEGVATPTATPLPTRTPTPNVTATPSETPTITPSITQTPKAGG